MPIPINEKLYRAVSHYADIIYDKPSAYKSGFIVKMYKKLGGKYREDHAEHNLERWYKEKWIDVGNKEYPVYRPSIRVNKNTPLTINEIDKNNLKAQIKLKQKIKGKKNLPPFKANMNL